MYIFIYRYMYVLFTFLFTRPILYVIFNFKYFEQILMLQADRIPSFVNGIIGW